MSLFRPGWYLLYTRPQHEKKVSARLEEIKIEHYLPTRKVLRTWHDRRRYVDEPLFPSYIFIHLKDMQNYYCGMDTEGALCYVKTGKEVASVRESVINNIKLAAGQPNDVEISSRRFEPGQKMVINQGALTGLSCELVQYENKQKLLIRVELLQRNMLLTVPAEYLMAI